MKPISIQPTWCLSLPLQQQSVLLLASRGPDGIAKNHPCKRVQRAYRACVLLSAYDGKPLEYGEGHGNNTFMGLDEFANDVFWPAIVEEFFNTADDIAHHFYMHILHGAEILGYKHPDHRISVRWLDFYLRGCKELHLWPEAPCEMDERLNDWGQEYWQEED